MNEINWYWFMHWWFIFYNLDQKSHDKAFMHLWDCLTSNANIYYHKPILNSEILNIDYKIDFISKTRSSSIIESKIYILNELYVTWIFTFVKIKKDNS